MADKCPKCGETLITKTIQKKMGSGSIDFPIAQVCPKCNWSRDLTGASDIAVKPPAPETAGEKLERKTDLMKQAPEKPKQEPEKPRPVPEKPKPAPEMPKQIVEKPIEQAAAPKKGPDMNKIITIALAILVIGAIIWAFSMKGTEQPGVIQPTPTPKPATTAVTVTAIITTTAAPEVTPTGNLTKVRIDRYKYSNPDQVNLKIKAGDEVVWVNDDSYALTLVSEDGLFAAKILDNGKETAPYLFNKTGTYTFDTVVGGVKKYSGTVVVGP
ncbi:Uncharacterised protein [uncultured archaeon]|nr:Uncharacterised protein [uncultured archaeon]